uniref:Protein kinase domain-containing protein n=1 Tax=Oryzias latipes TaxID=8090 RepID=A0A3P9JSG0_ORYLA
MTALWFKAHKQLPTNEDPALLTSSTLSDFQIIRTLGVGEFGHVDLVTFHLKNSHVQLNSNIKLNFAMRVLKKKLILNVRCLAFNPEQLYILTEVCLGGNLSSLVKEKFYTGCVVEALIYLHRQGVVYRDIKPECVALDEHGYAKLVLDGAKKTWTFCGTLGYMAPEIILSKGHGIHSDLWSLGVFVFELLSGR